MNNLNENPPEISKFQIRYLIIESKEQVSSSWCSNGKQVNTVRAKPVLQYTLDGDNWNNVPTHIEKDYE